MERASVDSKLYPQRIDKSTTIVGVSCREANGRVIYSYDNKLDLRKAEIGDQAISIQAADIRASLCSDPKLTALLRLVDMEYTYYDSSNVFVGTTMNRIEDCYAKPAGVVTSDKDRWVVVRRRADGGAGLQVDQTSLVRNGAMVRVWTRAVYREPLALTESPIPAKTVLALREVHCTQRTDSMRQVIFLAENGEQIALAGKEFPYEAKSIVPGDVMEDVLKIACSSSRSG